MNGESLFIMWRLSKRKSNDIQTQGVGLRSAGKVKIKIMKYEIVLLLHQSVQETLMMGANSGRHQEEEMKVSILLIIVNIISIIVNIIVKMVITNILTNMLIVRGGRRRQYKRQRNLLGREIRRENSRLQNRIILRIPSHD